MKTRILCVGKIKEGFVRDGVGEFLKRLRTSRIGIVEIPDSDVAREGRTLLERVRDGDCVVALAEAGEPMSSTAFADFIKKSGKDLCFIIGGPDGLSNEVLARADRVLSLSEMTFTHEMTRLILLEQLYRAFMINGGKPYHR